MHVSLQPAYIIHQRPYRDTSALVEVLSRDHGRVGLVARGARGAKSRLRGVLQAFRPLLVSWSGRGELMTLTDAEAAAPAPALGGRALLCAWYLNELLQRLIHRNDPHPELFEAYGEALAGLAEPAREETVLRVFERRLLQELGYGLVLDHDVRTGAPIESDVLYDYQLEHGPVAVADAGAAALPIRGASLRALARGEFADETSRREARRLTRAALAVYLGDKPLKSRELFVVK